jgi:formate hydrogenlyase subunit 3/multisubunit Na+/H+ antiporter MnhD subunit
MRWSTATRVIYGGCLAICVVVLVMALIQLVNAGNTASTLRLPLGLPWIGAHFRIDALAAFFLVVVSLGGASASLFAIGYGEHEKAPGRVLPFYAAFLAGMTSWCWPTTPSPSSSPGSSCRCPPGRW